MSEIVTKNNAAEVLTGALIQRVRRTSGVSRIELAREMGLAPSTIGAYVERLIAEGVFREGKKCQSVAGRPPTIVELNPHLGQFVGVDFEARQVSTATIDFSQDVLNRDTERLLSTDSADDVIKKIKQSIIRVTGQKPRLLGIGIGVPGTVDNRRGIAVHYEFIRGWRGIPLADLLATEFGVPVYLENNIRAMALAEHWFGGARNIDNFVCVGVRSGIGAGVVIRGQLQRGLGNMAGEIGGWPCPTLDPSDLIACETLEHQASVRAILQQITDAARNGATTSFKVSDSRAASIDELLLAARQKDDLVERILQRAAECLGRTICQINLLLNPELIIVAGPLAQLEDQFLSPIRKIVERLTPPLHGRVPRIIASQIGDFAGALGAATLAVHDWRPPR